MTAKLEKSIAQRNKTQRALDCTRTVLHKHEGKSIGQVSNDFYHQTYNMPFWKADLLVKLYSTFHNIFIEHTGPMSAQTKYL